MFFGQYHLSLDDRGRLELPPLLRARLAGEVVITQGFDGNLLLLKDGVFDGILQRAKGMNIADPRARLLLRLILSNASESAVDDSGRVFVTEDLRNYAQLQGEVVLIGQGDYLELWAPAHWEKQEDRLRDAEANADYFSQLNLSTG